MIDNSVLICIFNYKHDDNARKWNKLLSSKFKTFVLDSGNDKKCKDFIQFPNIYYSGLFNEVKRLSKEGDYKWIGVIPSDITIESDSEQLLIDRIKWLKSTENVGIWQPSLDKTSRNWLNNIHNDKYQYEAKRIIEGHFFFIRDKVFKTLPKIDVTKNRFGYGISEVMSAMSIKLGMYNIFDNTIQVHHPTETQYDTEAAIEESREWTPKVAMALGLDYKSMINVTDNSLGEAFIKYTVVSKNTYGNDAVWKICEPATRNFVRPNFSEKSRLIVTLTTWSARIQNIPEVLQRILDGEVLPDKIVLNVAEEEFKNKEADFPEKTAKFLKDNENLIEVNWLKNDTKVWKKVIPTLIKYPNDYILCMDDDFLYPSDFVKTFKEKLETDDCPFYGVVYQQWRGNLQHCGTGSVDRLDWLGRYLFTLDEEVMMLIGDDDFYTYCIIGNGIHPMYVGKKFHTNMEPFNSVDSYTKSANLNVNTIIKVLDKLADMHYDTKLDTKLDRKERVVINLGSTLPVVEAESIFDKRGKGEKPKVITISKEVTPIRVIPTYEPGKTDKATYIKVKDRLFI